MTLRDDKLCLGTVKISCHSEFDPKPQAVGYNSESCEKREHSEDPASSAG
jgi:hypothetical protein